LRAAYKTLLLSLALTALWVLHTHLNVFPPDDFIEYWSAGRLNITGGNPYNDEQMLTIEKSVGWLRDDALMMLNPPWTLSVAMFIGIFNYPLSRYIWFILGTAVVGWCAVSLWKLYHGNKKYPWAGLVVLFTFGPILHALKSGQITLLILLGMVGFLYFYRKGAHFWAGILASLLFVKPQLLYLVILAIFIWSLANKRYLILVGMISGLIISLGAVLVTNPNAVAQYFQMVRNYPFNSWVTTTIGANLRVLLGPDRFYLEFIPSVIGVAWFLVYWIKHHNSFDWINDLPLIILISAVTTAYAWTLDYMVCIIGILQISALFDFYRWSWTKLLILLMYIFIDLLVIFSRFNQNWYWWLPVSLLIWYLFARFYLYRPSSSQINTDPALS
jgi:hypothetical protein